jgi:hypothetical protein
MTRKKVFFARFLYPNPQLLGVYTHISPYNENISLMLTGDCMSYYNDEKLKNDFEKPKFDPYTPTARERGGCLSAFLAVLAVINALGCLYLCSQTSRLSGYYNSGAVMPILIVSVVLSAVTVVCVLGMWNWQRWGYYGLMVLYGLNTMANLCTGNLVGVVVSAAIMAILFGLSNEKLEEFD